MNESFESAYPNLARWVHEQGWIEIGADEYSSSLIRVLDEGGMVWESEAEYDSLDAALRDADAAILAWMRGE
jgi:hypothetical protein